MRFSTLPLLRQPRAQVYRGKATDVRQLPAEVGKHRAVRRAAGGALRCGRGTWVVQGAVFIVAVHMIRRTQINGISPFISSDVIGDSYFHKSKLCLEHAPTRIA